ncbi:MAG TPA: protein translocase subunit SecD [Bryobacteraceae bacterium]|nr:protein translocase subunit SecD [Bryobacteraceae bacterium]
MTRIRTRAIIILGVLLLSVYGIIGLPKSGEALHENLAENIKLGLDLKGGTYLILQVQVQDALKSEADRAIEQLKEELGKAGVNYGGIDRTDPQTTEEADSIQINIKGVDSSRSGDLRGIVSERLAAWNLTAVNATDYRLNVKPTELIAMKRDTVERTRKTIETRINSLGLTEPTIQQRGNAETEYEILVQLPGVDDPARVKQIMQAAAMLEIGEVKDGPFSSPEQARAKHGGVLPLNTKLVPSISRPGQESEGWYLVGRTPVITGSDLRSARPSRDEFGKWETDFTLNKDGARRFGRFTEANIGNRLAIILDNKVRSAPTVQSRIDDSGRITGARDQQDASDLALVLESGSLPAGVVYSREQTIGPSLGADSIRQGIVAGLVGLALVITVMLVYYNKSGLNAVIALLFNGVITLSALAYFGAVWTLPGIAGMILSLGMAVDSNVLIFERIREELRAGKSVPGAVEAGFDRAFVTIIDTHVVTVVSSAFLFMFGTGPVKGFAVTLVIGLIANLFTAVFVSRTMFDWTLSRQRQQVKLSI